jgi:hypothetical protein
MSHSTLNLHSINTLNHSTDDRLEYQLGMQQEAGSRIEPTYITPHPHSLSNELTHHNSHNPTFHSLLTTSSPFDSLFKVLFIFRSRYLFAIGVSQCI